MVLLHVNQAINQIYITFIVLMNHSMRKKKIQMQKWIFNFKFCRRELHWKDLSHNHNLLFYYFFMNMSYCIQKSCFYNTSVLPHILLSLCYSRRWMWLWHGGDWVSCLGGWMAAAALRFLAHCFEMTLPVSLSRSAGRGRIFIFSFLLPLSRSLCSAAALSFLSHLLSPCQAFFPCLSRSPFSE